MTRKQRNLLIGVVVAALGFLPFAAGLYYATALAGLPEFRAPLLSNAMGVCFWGGLLTMLVGFGFILTAAPRI
jgi:hypothetical protein